MAIMYSTCALSPTPAMKPLSLRTTLSMTSMLIGVAASAASSAGSGAARKVWLKFRAPSSVVTS